MRSKKSEVKSRTFIALLVMSFAAIFLFSFAIAPSILTNTLAFFNEGTYYNTTINSSGVVKLNRELPNNRTDESPYGGINMTKNFLLLHFNNNSAYGENSTFFYDFSGMGDNGNCSGTTCPIWNSSGKYGGAMQFDGVDDYIITTNLSSNSSLGHTYTLWVKPNFNKGDSIGQEPLIHWGSTDNPRLYLRFENSNALYVDFATPNEKFYWNGNYLCTSWSCTLPSYSAGNWYFIAMTGEGPMGPASDAYNKKAYIGYGGATHPTRYFNGSMDEVAIWNRTLSADEISKIYNLSAARYGNYQSKVYDMNGSVYWKNLSWTEGAPYGEELPSNNFDEKAANVLGGTNMTGNVLLMHLNNDSRFGENNNLIYDFSRYGNNGSCNSGAGYCPTLNSSGKFNGAYQFDGSDDYIWSANFVPDTLIGDHNPFTITVWHYPKDNTYSGRYIFGGSASGNDRFLIYHSVDSYKFTYGYGDWYVEGAGTSAIQNAWNHIAFEYNGSHIKIYHNGIEVYSAAYTGNGDLPNTGMPIGCVEQSANSCLAAHYKGLMDEFAIWNRSLSADEILNLYKRGANNLKFHARSCDDAACSGEDWQGIFNSTELPNNKTDERATISKGANMTGNIILYHFNNNSAYGENSSLFYDFSGNGNNGNCSLEAGTCTPWTSSGKYGGAIQINGSGYNGGYVSIPPSLIGDFTISVWFKADQALGDYVRIFDFGKGPSGDVFLSPNHIAAGGKIGMSFFGNSPWVGSGVPVVIGQWYHAVITYDKGGSGIKLYVDGQLKGSDAYNTASFEDWGAQTWYIGRSHWFDRYMNGSVDEFAMWNRTLSDSEVLDIYNREANNYFTNSTLSSINNIGNTTNRYFQYKAVFEADNNTNSIVPELFNITFNSDDGPPIVKLYPSNAFISTAVLNCSVISTTQIGNVTLYSNVTGTWQINQTANLTGNINSTIFNMNLSEGSYYKWNCQANNSIGLSAFAPSNNTFFLDYSPKISFISPTPGNATTVQSIQVNVSLTESYLQEFKWNWNNTNYTIYNDSLVLMMNFENRSELGEDSTHFKDLSNYNNNGYCNGGSCPIWNSSGRYGSTIQCDGDNDFVIVNDNANLRSNTETFEFWLRWEGASTPKTYSAVGVYGKDDHSDDGYVMIIDPPTGASRLSAYRKISGGWREATWGETIQQNIWYHIAAVYDNTNILLYVNGNLVDTDSYGTSTYFANTNYAICKYFNQARFFNGKLDEFRIWNRALSSAEIQQQYHSTMQKYNSTDWSFYSNQSNSSDGNYTYYAYARDLASTNQTETRYLTLDTSTPVISFGVGTEANDAAFNNRNWIYANVSAGVFSEANSTFIIYNSSWSDVTYNTTPQQRFLNWTNLGQGIYYYNVSVTTTAGISGSSETRKIILDSTTPFINFTTPTDNDGIHVARSNTYINNSINDDNLASAFIDFNRSLVGYWSFNWEAMNSSHVFDNSTYLNNGSINGATWNSSGKHGGAYSFDGVNDYIDVPHSASLSPTHITVENWIKFDSFTENYNSIVAKEDGVNGYTLLVKNNGKLAVYMTGVVVGTYDGHGSHTLNTGQWYHLAFTFNGSRVAGYVNGEEDYALNTAGTTGHSTSSLLIGKSIYGSGRYIDGLIDELRIWNRALSAAEINASFNAGLYNLYNNFTNLVDANYNYQAWVIDRAGNTNKTETRSVIIDMTAPTITNITLKSNDTTEINDIDAGDKVNVTVNVTDALTGVDSVKLQWKYSTGVYTDVIMSNNSGLGKDYYNASFIPTTEGNWIYRIWANDTLGNEIYSTATNVSANYEYTWTRTPTSFGTVSGILSTTRPIGNITLNNTGDYPLSFDLTHNSPYDLTFSSNTFTLTQKESKTIEVTATFGPVTREFDIVITIDAITGGADPSLTTTNFSLASYAGGPYFDVQIDVYPTIMNHSKVYNLSGYVKNLGNETGTGTSLNWTLPSGFTVNSGNITWNIGNITAGSISRSSLNISAPSTVSPGSYTFSLYSICDQCNDSGPCGNTSYYINDSQSKTTSLACSKISDSVCGDGCTYETDASNYDPDCTAPAPVTIQSGGGGTMGGGGAAAITSEATFELVRGKDQGFSLVVNNPYKDATLTNLKVAVEGYLAQYITVDYPNNIAPGSSATLTIKIAAPAYFTKGIHNLTFIVNSIKEKGLIKESWSEKRYVTLAVHEISKIDSEKLLNETSSLIEEMKTANLGVKIVSKLLAQSQIALDSNDYEEIQRINDMIKKISQSAFDASNLISEIANKIASSEYMGINTPETSRLLELAKVAAEREDYALAFERAKEADLTYAVETKGEYNIGYFIARNSTEVFIGTLIAFCLLFVLYLRVKLTLVNVGLKESREEEDVLLGLMKETQKETFVENKRSMEEYNESMIQYENRLSKAVQRAIELETIRANLFRFKGERKRLEQERERLLNLMRETQAKYLQGGMIESRIYQNKMHSFSSRLSEIEEKLALREAEKAIKRGKLLPSFKREG